MLVPYQHAVLAWRMQEALRSTASTSGRPRDLLPDGLLDALPTMMQNIKVWCR